MSSKDEMDSLLRSASTMHTMPIKQLYSQLQTSAEGLDKEKTRAIRSISGLNKVPPPLQYPAWLCCLLPCLLKTKAMLDYNEVVPEHATVRRDKTWVKIDSTSLVPGDIVVVKDEERVPADLRIIEVGRWRRIDAEISAFVSLLFANCMI